MIRSILIGILILLGATVAAAQTAQITGRITDAPGAVIPDAQVTVTNVATGIETKVTSNDEGYYTVPLLQPAAYSIAVQKQGFRTTTRSGVELQVEQVANIDFALEVGNITEEVVVTAAAPLLDSETSSRGQVISNRAVEELPLNGRNFLQLARLTPGVVEPPRGDRASAGGSFTANGVRATLNNFLLDGVDNNSRIVDIQNSSNVVVQPSVDAIEEFKVQTSGYAAEFGYAAGALVNATIKSGTNRFNGTLFEFVRNDVFDARDFFLPPNQPKQKLRRNQFGGVLGGPIIREKAFFFGSYEGTLERRGVTYVRTVPDAAQRSGNFSGLGRPIFDPVTTSGTTRTQFIGNTIPTNRLDPVAVQLLSLLPLPNVAGQTVNNFISNPVRRDDRDQLDFRIDYNISDRDRLFGRYSFTDRLVNNPGPFEPPLVGSNFFTQSQDSQRAQGLAISETHTFSGNMINEARLGYNRVRDNLLPFATERLFEQFGIRGVPDEPGVTGLPEISITGFANLGEATFLPNFKISETFQVLDNVLFTLGSHSVKTGFNFRYIRSFFNVSGQARGQLGFSGAFTQDPQNRATTGSAIADFLLGFANTATISNAFLGDIRYQYYGAYIQDDWKVSPRLTLNLGLRYELFTPPVERTDRQGNFDPITRRAFFPNNQVPEGIPASLVMQVPEGVSERGLLGYDKNNFAPRLGFAYQLFQRTVVRGGGGVFYADQPAVGAGNRLVGNPPFRRAISFPSDQLTPGSALQLQNGFPADSFGRFNLNPAATNFIYFTPDFPQAYVYQYNLDVQHEFPGLLVEVGYVGTLGRQLPVSFDLNQPVPGQTSVASRRPIQGFAGIITEQPLGNSSYSALQVKAERRFSRGFSLLAAYTFSKAIDDGGEQLNGDDQRYRDSRNLRLERSLSLFDIRHRFVASYLLDLPFGRGRRFDFDSSVLNAIFGDFQLNGIATIRTGAPFTPSLNFSTAGAGVGDNRPNRIGDGNLPRGERTIQRFFDPTAFAPALTNQIGNAGKNILIGPGATNFDLSLFKRIPFGVLGDRGEIQLRAEAFNVFNTPQFGIPNAQLQFANVGGQFVLSNQNTGGQITTLAVPQRELQFGLKFLF